MLALALTIHIRSAILYNPGYPMTPKKIDGTLPEYRDISALAMLKTYYRLTKPGIIYGNLLTAIGGFLLAARGNIDFGLLLVAAAGTSLIIASACVFNNYIDRDIDAHMARTRKRALVSGEISGSEALIFGSILGVLGAALLYLFTNLTTLVLGTIGFVTYVLIYTYTKRKTIYGTLIGSIPGATPITAGYTAVTGHFDMGAALLFLILVLWQMPHFYAISIFRRDDYKAAGIPVMSVVRGVAATKRQILLYIFALVFAVYALWAYGYVGFIHLFVVTAYTLFWLYRGVRGMKENMDDTSWARKMFGLSLLFLLIFSIMLALDAWLL